MNITLRLANYISRYAPSRKKVTTYLTRKNCLNPSQLLSDTGYDESMMADMWMRSFVSLGKWQREMSTKLMKKEFPKDMILEKIEMFDAEIHDWDSHRSSIIHQIRTLEQRGKAKKIIEMNLLGKYPYFRDQIREILIDTIDTDAIQKEVQKYKNKYNTKDPKEKQKYYGALLRKWFSYADIKNTLSLESE